MIPGLVTLTQAMEQRYSALAAVHGKLSAEKERLQQENGTLREVRRGWHAAPLLAALLFPPSAAALACLSSEGLTWASPVWELQEVTAARSEVHKLQTALMQKDAELERRNLENRSLAQDKASLERLLQERDSDIQELQTRLQAGAVRCAWRAAV